MKSAMYLCQLASVIVVPVRGSIGRARGAAGDGRAALHEDVVDEQTLGSRRPSAAWAFAIHQVRKAGLPKSAAASVPMYSGTLLAS